MSCCACGTSFSAPMRTYEGNLASFYPKSKQHASLMFHTGARIPGRHPLLEGSGDTSRVMKVGSVAEAEATRSALERIVRAWCEWRESERGASGGGKKKPAKKPAARR